MGKWDLSSGSDNKCRQYVRSIIKILFLIFNLITTLIGIIIVILGIVTLASGKYLELISAEWINTPIFLIVCGILISIFGLLGCFGAITELKFILIIYSLILLIEVIFLFSGCIAGFVWSSELSNGIESQLRKNINSSMYSSLIDDIQQTEKCCGVTNYTDWFNTPFADKENVTTNDTVPMSCCIEETARCQYNNMNKLDISMIYTNGCYDKFLSIIQEYFGAFIGVILVFAVVMASGILLSWLLICIPGSESSGIFKKGGKGYEVV